MAILNIISLIIFKITSWLYNYFFKFCYNEKIEFDNPFCNILQKDCNILQKDCN